MAGDIDSSVYFCCNTFIEIVKWQSMLAYEYVFTDYSVNTILPNKTNHLNLYDSLTIYANPAMLNCEDYSMCRPKAQTTEPKYRL